MEKIASVRIPYHYDEEHGCFDTPHVSVYFKKRAGNCEIVVANESKVPLTGKMILDPKSPDGAMPFDEMGSVTIGPKDVQVFRVRRDMGVGRDDASVMGSFLPDSPCEHGLQSHFEWHVEC